MKHSLALCATFLSLAPIAQAGAPYTSAEAPAAPQAAPKIARTIGEPFYVDLKGGATFLQDSDGVSFDTGWGISGAFGYNLGDGLSVQLESGFYQSDIESFDGQTDVFDLSLGGDVTLIPIMANVKWVFPVTSLFNAYIGAGLGTIYSEADVSVGSLSIGGDQWDFAFQAIAGISIPMSEVLSFDAGYRFMGTGFKDSEIRSHSVQAGINFKF